MDFHNKVVFVAGGTGGLGRGVTKAFLAAGAIVVVTYVIAAEFDALKSETAQTAAAALVGVMADVTDENAVEKVVADIVAKHGQIDILVNTVGAYAGGKSLWDTEARTYDQMLQLNLKSGFVLARAIVPVMIRQNRGWVVNIASKAAVDHAASGGLYEASKAAALALFDSLAADVKHYNINVNLISPSIIDTPANRSAMPKADFSKWPKSEEIASVILFMCSEEARVIHGAAIPVYGKT